MRIQNNVTEHYFELCSAASTIALANLHCRLTIALAALPTCLAWNTIALFAGTTHDFSCVFMIFHDDFS